MRSLVLASLVAFSLAASAQAQTAGTTFPNNQDPANTPAQQSMQEVGGSSTHGAVDVQGERAREPKLIAAHHRQTTTRRRNARPAKAPAGK